METLLDQTVIQMLNPPLSEANERRWDPSTVLVFKASAAFCPLFSLTQCLLNFYYTHSSNALNQISNSILIMMGLFGKKISVNKKINEITTGGAAPRIPGQGTEHSCFRIPSWKGTSPHRASSTWTAVCESEPLWTTQE